MNPAVLRWQMGHSFARQDIPGGIPRDIRLKQMEPILRGILCGFKLVSLFLIGGSAATHATEEREIR